MQKLTTERVGELLLELDGIRGALADDAQLLDAFKDQLEDLFSTLDDDDESEDA